MIEIISGIISGVISALGLGGGTFLIILLSIFIGINQHKAQATNIIFFIPTAVTAIIMNIKNRNIQWNFAKWICPIGMIGAIIGAVLAINIETFVLKKLYGLFLAVITLYEIFCLILMYKKKSKKHNKNKA